MPKSYEQALAEARALDERRKAMTPEQRKAEDERRQLELESERVEKQRREDRGGQIFLALVFTPFIIAMIIIWYNPYVGGWIIWLILPAIVLFWVASYFSRYGGNGGYGRGDHDVF